MKAFTKNLAILGMAFICSAGSAQVVQKMTNDALIIVARPLDMWSPDSSYMSKTLEAIQDKKASFMYNEPQGKLIDVYSTFLQSPPSAPITDNVIQQLGAKGFKIGGAEPTSNRFQISKPNTINPAEFSEFVAAQNAVYTKLVISAGNPDNLKSKESVRKFIGGLTSAATFFAVGDKFGYSTANNAVIGNGAAFDLGNSVQKFGQTIVPRPLPQIDLSSYAQVEIHRVDGLKALGYVVIAYKQPKTLETERLTLAEAIYSLTGADTTTENVIKARADDFESRQKIWGECVAKGECHD